MTFTFVLVADLCTCRDSANACVGAGLPQKFLQICDVPCYRTQANSRHLKSVLGARRYSAIKAVVIGFVMTFFPIFDVPVFWPILLLYWFVLFFVTMKRQIKHMIKYRYIPFSMGKKVRPK